MLWAVSVTPNHAVLVVHTGSYVACALGSPAEVPAAFVSCW